MAKNDPQKDKKKKQKTKNKNRGAECVSDFV